MKKFFLYTLLLGAAMMTACTNSGDENSFTITTSAVFKGYALQIGVAGSQTVVDESVIDNAGKAVVKADIMSQYAGSDLWFCVPRVAKFFHTLTAEEAAANAITLPDKDKGSTLDATGLRNDWIVALYMGVNSGGTTDGLPLYWATGNLIAVKTSAVGEPSQVAYHVATAEETSEEGTRGNSFVGMDERLINNVPDGYVNMPVGSKWDMYCFGDKTGLMLYDSDKVGPYCVASGQMTQDRKDIVFAVSGDERFDAARAQLGGLWRLPTCGKAGANEFAAFEDDVEEYASLLPDGQTYGEEQKSLGMAYSYTVSEGIVNTLLFPAAGFRHATEKHGGVATQCLYWSGTADPTGTPPYLAGGQQLNQTMPEFFTAFNYGYLEGAKSWFPHPRTSSQALRPVTE